MTIVSKLVNPADAATLPSHLSLVADATSNRFVAVDADGNVMPLGSDSAAGEWVSLLPPAGVCVSIPLADALPGASISGSVHEGGA